jgi:hypothetical protein
LAAKLGEGKRELAGWTLAAKLAWGGGWSMLLDYLGAKLGEGERK